MQTKLLSFLLLLTLFFSCKKSGTEESQQPSEAKGEKVKRGKGAEAGAVSKQTIGTGGGTVTSADGYLTLTVPAGAVDAATEFSIQPVENMLQTKGRAYRLLPEGVAFKKELTLRFSYATSAIPAAERTTVFPVFQDAEGYYHQPLSTESDAAAQTLTVHTKHFSDWTFASKVELQTDKRQTDGKVYLYKNESVKFTLVKYFTDPKVDPYTNDTWLFEDLAFDIAAKVSWTKTSTQGTLTPQSPQTIADYKAPATIPTQQEILVTGTVVDDNLGKDNTGQIIRQMMLSQTIVLLPDSDEFFEVTEDGATERCVSPTAELVPGYMSIGAYRLNGHSIQLYLFGSTTGNYAYGLAGQPGKASAEYSVPRGVGFISFRVKECSGINPEIIYSSGAVILSKKAAFIGDYSEGTFSTNFYDVNWCGQGRTKNISGRFKIRKNF